MKRIRKSIYYVNEGQKIKWVIDTIDWLFKHDINSSEVILRLDVRESRILYFAY